MAVRETRRDPIVIAASVGQAGLGGLVLSLQQYPRCDGHHKFAVLRGSGGSFAGHAIRCSGHSHRPLASGIGMGCTGRGAGAGFEAMGCDVGAAAAAV